MHKKWTGTIIGGMHVYGISTKELAEELGISVSYLRMILNGDRKPAKAKEAVFKAFKKLVKDKERDAEIDSMVVESNEVSNNAES